MKRLNGEAVRERGNRALRCRAPLGRFSAERGNIMEEFRTEGGPQQGLYDPRFEHDACGIGCVVDIKGR